ncbi:GNAT family N-acetyltransferase [Prauserella halophila]|uniref:GNAT family N-acetyltransferase n=1 Tax=Prauserella halophila TaxID=185641 RepID=A0ABN1W2R0_9PSEU|nr:GNAT family N-acetyltransferase [Prauserella halophila]MCP2236379.1 hypothetical protein [Prauserella halophila]
MTVHIDVLDPRTDPEPADWAEFAAARQLPAPWDYDMLRLETNSSRCPNLLVVARDRGTPVAALSVTVARPGDLHRRRPVGGAARFTPRLAEVHQPWMPGTSGRVFAPGLDPTAQRQLMRSAERALVSFIGPGCGGVVHRYVRDDELPAVTGRGRAVRDAVPTTLLENGFTDVDGWVSSLARSRRHSIRGQRRKIAADPSLTIRCGRSRDDLEGAELATLLHAHRAKFGRVPLDLRGAVTAEYLHALVRRPDVATLTYRDASSGRLLAFTNVLDHAVTPLHQHWAAVPPDRGGKRHLYFDAYARVVGFMIDNGRPSISSGRGMQDVKGSLGFAPRPLQSVVAPRPVCR